MLQFYKTKDHSGIDIAINPTSVAHLEQDKQNWCYVVMQNGRRYYINEDCIKLSDKLEMLANYKGC